MTEKARGTLPQGQRRATAGIRPDLSGFRVELEITDVMNPFTVDTAKLGLQMHTPDLRIVGHLITVQGQAVDNGIEH